MLVPVLAVVFFFIFMYKARLVWWQHKGKFWRFTALFWGAIAVGSAFIGAASAISPRF